MTLVDSGVKLITGMHRLGLFNPSSEPDSEASSQQSSCIQPRSVDQSNNTVTVTAEKEQEKILVSTAVS